VLVTVVCVDVHVQFLRYAELRDADIAKRAE
jgi:hypothetical protein